MTTYIQFISNKKYTVGRSYEVRNTHYIFCQVLDLFYSSERLADYRILNLLGHSSHIRFRNLI
jgi:hypothetical protein